MCCIVLCCARSADTTVYGISFHRLPRPKTPHRFKTKASATKVGICILKRKITDDLAQLQLSNKYPKTVRLKFNSTDRLHHNQHTVNQIDGDFSHLLNRTILHKLSALPCDKPKIFRYLKCLRLRCDFVFSLSRHWLFASFLLVRIDD